MPYPWAGGLIERVTGSNLHHVAICLPLRAEVNVRRVGMHRVPTVSGPKLVVYEAQPPRARSMSPLQYTEQIQEWKAAKPRWRERKHKYLEVELARGRLSEEQLHDMQQEAARWMGTRYGMVWNYTFNTSAIHCSELVARVLTESFKCSDNPVDLHLTDDLNGRIDKPYWPCKFSRVTPIMIREKLAEAGWEIKKGRL